MNCKTFYISRDVSLHRQSDCNTAVTPVQVFQHRIPTRRWWFDFQTRPERGPGTSHEVVHNLDAAPEQAFATSCKLLALEHGPMNM